MYTPLKCKVLGHKLKIEPSTSIRVERNGTVYGYDVLSVCVRKRCIHVDPVPIFFGIETPDALYLEHDIKKEKDNV